MGVEVQGLREAIQRVKASSKALKDLTPAYKQIGAFVVKGVDDCFDRSVDWDGRSLEPLKQSTIDKRVGNLKAANKRSKKGTLTKAASALREKLRAPGGIKPMVDTGRARNSSHADASRDGVVWSAVGYLRYHLTGYGQGDHVGMPDRNPTPFSHDGSDAKLHPRLLAEIRRVIIAHVHVGAK